MKLKEFQAILAKEKIDLAILMFPDPNLVYFTQQQFSQAILAISSADVKLFITKLDRLPKITGIKTLNFDQTWSKELSKNKIRRVGLNYTSLTLADFEKLKKIFPAAEFIDVSKILQDLRSIKTSKEVSLITTACKITAKAFEAVAKEFSKGTLLTEQDVALFLEKEIRTMNAELAFPTIVAMGPNAAIPHHVTGNSKLTRGFLVMDFGAKYSNYCADMTRVVFLGKPSTAEINKYDLLLKCQEETIKQIAENKSFIELDNYARKRLGKYADQFTHSLGHGIGIEVHEAPAFRDKKIKISKNQVFTIEPGIYVKDQFGLRIEDTLIFNGKIRVLTTAFKELIVIEKFR